MYVCLSVLNEIYYSI
jgi:hypothetical protein